MLELRRLLAVEPPAQVICRPHLEAHGEGVRVGVAERCGERAVVEVIDALDEVAERVERGGRHRLNAAVLQDRLPLLVPVLAGIRAALVLARRFVLEGWDDVVGMAAVPVFRDDAVGVGRLEDVLAVARRVTDRDRFAAPNLRLLLQRRSS